MKNTKARGTIKVRGVFDWAQKVRHSAVVLRGVTDVFVNRWSDITSGEDAQVMYECGRFSGLAIKRGMLITRSKIPAMRNPVEILNGTSILKAWDKAHSVFHLIGPRALTGED